MCPISAVDSFYDAETSRFYLIIADEMGYVRIQDISSILLEFDLQPVDFVTGNIKRNPWRVLAIDKAEIGLAVNRDNISEHSSDNEEAEVEPLLKEFQFVQIAQWQAHKDVIKSVKYIKETDIPIIFTTSMDRMARIWAVKNDRVVPMGTLR